MMLLGFPTLTPHLVQIHRAAAEGAVVGLVAIDARGVASFACAADRQGVAVGR